MIFVGNIREVQNGEYDEVWAIVRSQKNASTWMRQVVELSPSWELFRRVQELKAKNQWNADSFDKEYVPVFLREMREKSARDRLNELFVRDKRGERIALVCFCPDERLCHRSIVAGLLQGVGCDVVTKSGTDFRHFSENYQKI